MYPLKGEEVTDEGEALFLFNGFVVVVCSFLRVGRIDGLSLEARGTRRRVGRGL